MVEKKGFPVKIWIIILLLLTWNVLVVLDISQEGISQVRFGLLTIIASGILDLFLVVTILSGKFKDFVLRKGHSYKEIKLYVYTFFIVLTLFMISLIMSMLKTQLARV
jgi:hypothetical protein